MLDVQAGRRTAGAFAAAAFAVAALALADTGCLSAARASAATPARHAPRAHGRRVVAYLVLTFDGSALDLYVDGHLSASRAVSGPIDRGAPALEIGAYYGRDWWNGAIDELALYDVAVPRQVVAAHYRAGLRPGADYASAVRRTAGLTDYMRMNDPRQVTDATGRARGVATRHGVTRWHSLIVSSDDPALGFSGFGTEVRVSGARPARQAFTVEVWALAGPQLRNHVIVSRANAWFLKTNVFGHWTTGVFSHGHIASLRSPLGAIATAPMRSPLRTVGGTPLSHHAAAAVRAPAKGSPSTLVFVAVLLALAAAIAALYAATRGRRRRAPAGGAPAGDGNTADAPAGDGTTADAPSPVSSPGMELVSLRSAPSTDGAPSRLAARPRARSGPLRLSLLSGLALAGALSLRGRRARP